MSAEGSGGGWEGGSAEQTRLPDWKTKSTGHFHTEVQDRSLSTAVQEAYPVSTQLKRQVIPPPQKKKKKVSFTIFPSRGEKVCMYINGDSETLQRHEKIGHDPEDKCSHRLAQAHHDLNDRPVKNDESICQGVPRSPPTKTGLVSRGKPASTKP